MKYLIISAYLFITPQLKAQSIKPGLWKTKENVHLNGLPLPATQDEECITAHQAKDMKMTIEKELKKQGCSLVKWKVKNQKLEAVLKCKNQDMEASGKLSGEFSRKSYKLKGEAQGTFKQVIPANITFNLSGQWIKNCSKK